MSTALFARFCSRPIRLRVCILTAVLLLLGAASARAATYTVTTLVDSNEHNCTASLCSLRDAIEGANDGDTIVFQSGLTGTITLLGGVLDIEASITITGPGANLLTIDGNNSTGVFQIGNVSTPTVSMSGLTIANGKSNNTGGAISLGNPVDSAVQSTLTVTNCAFLNNTATNAGGAIYSIDNLTVKGSFFSGNSSQGGGAIYYTTYVAGGTTVVTSSTFERNSAGAGGGAINANGNATVTNNTFVDNFASEGGAIDLEPYAVVKLTVSNNIISGNTASDHGAGLSGLNGDGGPQVDADHNVYYHNLTNGSEDNCNSCNYNTNAVSASSNPLTLPLGYYGGGTPSYLPPPGSKAICAGSSSATRLPSVDQRGFTVSSSYCSNGEVDAGADQSNYLTVTTLDDQTHATTCINGDTCSLRDAFQILFVDNLTNGDIDFAPALASTNPPATMVLGSPLPAIAATANIIGPGANALTVSGGNASTVGSIFTVNSGVSAAFYGLAIANGSSSSAGGGINNAGTVTLLNSSVVNNSAPGGFGGGIYNTGTFIVADSTIANNSAQDGGGIFSEGTVTATYTSISLNGSTSPSVINGGGIFVNGGLVSLTASTVSGNVAQCVQGSSGCDAFTGYGGGIAINAGALALANTVVAGNSANGDAPDIYGSYNDFGGNIANASNPQLSLLQLNGVGATVETMIPLPGSTAICAGNSSNTPLGVTTDERGFPNSNTTYTGYSSSSRCVDAGAVQTNYTGVQWVQQPTSTEAGTVIAPSPSVEVLEKDTLLSSNNTDAILGVPVTISPAGALTLSSGILTEPSAGTGTIATFGDLIPSIAGTGFTFTTDEITVVGSKILSSVSSQAFNVNPMTAPTVTLSFSPNAIAVSGTSTLTITIANPGSNPAAMTGIQFDDTLPSGLSAESGTGNTCGNIVSISPNSIGLGGFSLAPNTSCAVSVLVSSALTGIYQDSVTVESSNAANGTASAALQVGIMPPTIAPSFNPASIALGGSSTLTITITNPNSVAELTGVGFSDNLPNGLSTGSGIGNNCGQIVAVGPNSITLGGVSIAANTSCAVTVPITPAEYGVFQDSTGPVSSNEGGNGSAASATLTATAPVPTVTGISPATGPPPGGTAVTISGTSFNANSVVVNFGATAATNVTVVSATRITATSPSGTGTVDVTVTTPSGASTTSSADQFAYVAPNFVVNTTADDGSGIAGKCPAGGSASACTLRDALAAASTAGSGYITFSPSVFNTPQTLVASNGTLNLPSFATISGPTNGSGNALQNLVTISGGSTSNGYSAFSVASGVTSASIANLTITDSGSEYAGGVNNAGALTIQNCTLTGTDGDEAGAIYNNGGTLVIADSTISGNHSGHYGGALYTAAGSVTVMNSTITGNSGAIGSGGLLVTGGSLNISDSTVSGNFGGLYGPGVYNTHGTLTITNSIVSLNREGTPAAPGNYDDIDDMSGATTFTTGNGGGNVIGYYNTNSATAPTPAANLAPLASYGGPTQTMVPLPGSPAICAASLPGGFTTDQRGYPLQPSGGYCTSGRVDAGAVQSNYTSVAFVQQPTDAAINTNMSPAPTVEVLETDALLTSNNTDAVGGIPVTVTPSGGTYAGSPFTATTSSASPYLASFSSLSSTTLASGISLSTSSIPVTGSFSLPAVTSNTYDVLGTTAVLTSPASNTTLGGPVVTFNWTAAAGATGYTLRLGTTPGGSNNLYGSGVLTTTSVTRTDLPTNGETIYARLYTHSGPKLVYNDYSFTAAATGALTSPANNSTLAGPAVTFNWSAAPAASFYVFRLGTTGPGSNNIYGSGNITTTSVTRSNLPTNGETIYARLYTVFGPSVVHSDYIFTAATAAALTLPAPNSTLGGSTVTFNWTAAPGATSYTFRLGTTQGGYDIYGSGPITTTTVTRTHLPTNGETIYARLYTQYGSVVVYTDYLYTAAP